MIIENKVYKLTNTKRITPDQFDLTNHHEIDIMWTIYDNKLYAARRTNINPNIDIKTLVVMKQEKNGYQVLVGKNIVLLPKFFVKEFLTDWSEVTVSEESEG